MLEEIEDASKLKFIFCIFLQTQKTFVDLHIDKCLIKNRMQNTPFNIAITLLTANAAFAWWWHYIKDIGDRSCTF